MMSLVRSICPLTDIASTFLRVVKEDQEWGYYHLPMRFKVDSDTEETGVLEDNQHVTNAKRSRARAQRPTYELIVKLAMETVQIKPMLPKESSNNVSREPFGFVYQEHPLFVKPERAYTAVVNAWYSKGGPLPTAERQHWWLIEAHHSKKICRLDQVLFTQDEATSICQHLVNALSKWPNIDWISFDKGSKTNKSQETAQLLLNAAISTYFPEKPVFRFGPRCGRANQNLVIEGRLLVGRGC